VKFEFKAAIFDMDGTLLDSMRYWRLGCLEYLLAHNLPVPDEILMQTFQSPTTRLVMRALEILGIEGDRDAIWGEIRERMRRRYVEDVKPKAFVREYLDQLRAADVKMCIATASPQDYANIAFARHGLHGHFAFITGEEGVGATKHEPEFFEKVVAKLGVPPEDCVVFEDALYAIKTAKRAGLRVCAIEDGTAHHDREEIQSIADRYITGFDELLI
jgi:HAD superfamily hydrolase (TIGR01509 family)